MNIMCSNYIIAVISVFRNTRTLHEVRCSMYHTALSLNEPFCSKFNLLIFRKTFSKTGDQFIAKPRNMSILFFIFSVLLKLAYAKKHHANTIEELYANSIPPSNPFTTYSMYGYNANPVPEGIDLVYGWTYGKIVIGVENDKIYPSQDAVDSLDVDFYWRTCPNIEQIVFSEVKSILATNDRAAPQLLRLFFHDCFIEGCDASVLLTDTTNQVERDAIPNKTLKGFEFVGRIKMALEKECPGTVSCADILALATRDAVGQSGGPFYPIMTGRRDSRASFFGRAATDIPSPFGNISETLRLFSERGFTARDTVALLGAHNIGRINCTVILPRILNPVSPDPFVSPDFAAEIRQMCQDENALVISPETPDETNPQPPAFGPRYYNVVLKGKGLTFADMQLMTREETATVVIEFASEADGTAFFRDFTFAIVKMSSLQPLTGSQGEIRNNCSFRN